MKRIGKITVFILTALWMAFIFCMSAEPAEESTDMSLSVGYIVGRIVVDDFDSLSEEEQRDYAEKIDHPVRKTAHFTEYAVLGMLLSVDLMLLAVKRREDKPLKGTQADRRISHTHSAPGGDKPGAPDEAGTSQFAGSAQLRCFVPSWLMGTVYAGTDEFHQLFVPGRSGQLTDVLIDSSGVLLGCAVVYLANLLFLRLGSRNGKTEQK